MAVISYKTPGSTMTLKYWYRFFLIFEFGKEDGNECDAFLISSEKHSISTKILETTGLFYFIVRQRTTIEYQSW